MAPAPKRANKLPEGYIDALNASQMTGLAKTTILNSIKTNKLHAEKSNGIWAIKIEDLKKYIDNRKVDDDFISFSEAAKKLQVSTSTISKTVKLHNIEIKKAGRNATISKEDFKKIKEILKITTPGRKAKCASIYFRKFGKENYSGVPGPFLEARSGTYEFGRKILGQIPLKNIRPETIEKAKAELVKSIEDQGITEIHDRIKVC